MMAMMIVAQGLTPAEAETRQEQASISTVNINRQRLGRGLLPLAGSSGPAGHRPDIGAPNQRRGYRWSR